MEGKYGGKDLVQEQDWGYYCKVAADGLIRLFAE